MTREEFLTTTGRLQEMYNKTLNETQLQFWFDELKRYEQVKYQRAVGEYVKQNRTMPTISDILDKIRNLKPLEADAPQEIKQVHCETCKGSGLVKYMLDGYEYLCRCYCENAKQFLMMPFRDYKDVFYYKKPKIEEAPAYEIDVSQINF